MTPASAGAPGDVVATLYGSETDDANIIEDMAYTMPTYTTKSYPHDIWM